MTTKEEQIKLSETGREEIATELLKGCPEESLADHKYLAELIRSGASRDEILSSPECDRWPETYVWLENNF